jgi:succinyl-diaminopimelate desuccinylase
LSWLETCRKFIAVDSSPSAGTEAIGRFAAELCQTAGLTVETQPDSRDGLRQLNVIAQSTPGLREPGLALLTHLDTADPGTYAAWTQTAENPFNASIYQDRMYGLGVTSKLDFICKLEAMRRIDPWRLKRSVQLIGSFGEENGMRGALRLVRHKKLQARWVLVGEPTELRVANASLGFAAVEVRVSFSAQEMELRRRHWEQELSSSQSKLFRGKAAHASHPKLGENAIVAMLDHLAQLPEGILVLEVDGGSSVNVVPESAHLEIDVAGELSQGLTSRLRQIMRGLRDVEQDFFNYRAEGFEPNVPTMNIGLVRTREDHVLLGGSCRWPPSVTEDAFSGWIAALRGVCEAVGAQFKVTEHRRPFRAPADHDFVAQCRSELASQGGAAEPVNLSTCTEASILGRTGLDCVIFGPGQGVGNSHKPNEWISIKDLQRATDFYRGMIERMCF